MTLTRPLFPTLALTLLAMLSLPAEGEDDTTAATTPTTPAPTGAAPAARTSGQRLGGTIASIDPAAKTVTFTTRDDGSTTVTYTTATTVTIDGKAAAIGDLQTGDKASARISDGVALAIRVRHHAVSGHPNGSTPPTTAAPVNGN